MDERSFQWDYEESPYFKGVEIKMDEDKDLTVSEVFELKCILEAQIQELLEEFERRVDLDIVHVDFDRNDTGDISDVFVGVML